MPGIIICLEIEWLINIRKFFLFRLATEEILFSMVSAFGEIFHMFGDEKNEARALNLWLKLALQFDCLENKCSAFMALAKHFGMKESFKVKLIEQARYVQSRRLKN